MTRILALHRPERPRRIPTILAFVDYYLPGFKAGGPLRAVSNLIEAIGDRVSFKVVTRDRDRDDDHRFPGVQVDSWQRVGKADVMYLPVEELSIWRVSEILEDSGNAPIFLNSLFSPVTRRVLILNKLARRRRVVVLAPRGECAASALIQKKTRKAFYLGVAAFLGWYEDLIWLSSSAHESDDIRAMWYRLGVQGRLEECPELPMNIARDIPVASHKKPGTLNAAFLGRIVPVKNLLGSLQLLKGVTGNVNFTIYGPREDNSYWNLCEREIQDLPPNIRVTYAGPIAHARVPEVLAQQELLIAPSFGENYGHSIVEALSVGCPVLTSDQTPWRGLAEAGAGWDLDLEDIAGGQAALSSMVAMDSDEHTAMRRHAKEYARIKTNYDGVVQWNYDFFSTLPTVAA